MTSFSNGEVRRCRPLLGTFVEITAAGAEEAQLGSSIDAAFAAVERVQRLMSVHDAGSELSRVNEQAFAQSVKVSPETFEVLHRGIEIARDCRGAFDFTVAPLLARWGLLPSHLRRKGRGDWQDVRLLAQQHVRFAKPLAIDLGGIAKGYAVDAAIETLRAHKVPKGMVNAGGDLRLFGAGPSTIHLRHPVQRHLLCHSLQVCEAALATSSPCFTERLWRRRPVSHLANPLDRCPVTGRISVTVRARECWLADALTKVVLNAPGLAERLLNKHHAQAFVFAA